MIVEYDCEVCGAHVRKSRSPATIKTPPRYCSQRCNGVARKGTGSGITPNYSFECQTCGKHCDVYRSPSTTGLPRFCSVQCTGAAQLGASNPSFTGGRHELANGYVVVLCPEHPNCDTRGYVYEHRRVMEQVIGRYLTKEEVVHHVNEVKNDNRPENLRLLPNQRAHLALHRAMRTGK